MKTKQCVFVFFTFVCICLFPSYLFTTVIDRYMLLSAFRWFYRGFISIVFQFCYRSTLMSFALVAVEKVLSFLRLCVLV